MSWLGSNGVMALLLRGSHGLAPPTFFVDKQTLDPSDTAHTARPTPAYTDTSTMSRAGDGSGGAGGRPRRSSGAPAPEAAEDRLKVVSATMQRFFVCEYDLPLDSICPAENSRQINPSGVKVLEESIKKQGFMMTSPPQVMFPDLNEGEEMTQEKASTMRAICIDGSHR